jgi:hypothetical protein
MAPPIPLSVLGVVFVAWLLGVLVVVAVLRGDDGRRLEERRDRDPDPGR